MKLVFVHTTVWSCSSNEANWTNSIITATSQEQLKSPENQLFNSLFSLTTEETSTVHSIVPLWGESTTDWRMTLTKQSSWGQHWAHLGPVGPRWAPCWSHEHCSVMQKEFPCHDIIMDVVQAMMPYGVTKRQWIDDGKYHIFDFISNKVTGSYLPV